MCDGKADGYLTVNEVAERLHTKPRFVRRLIEERRIDYSKFGTHVRIAESTLAAYKAAAVVPAIPARRPLRAVV